MGAEFDARAVADGMNEGKHGVAYQDPIVYSERIKDIYDRVSNRPHWVNELVRVTGYDPASVSRICYHLEEEGWFNAREIEDNLFKYVGNYAYQPYLLWSHKDADELAIDEAIRDIIALSNVGLVSSQFMELALQEAGVDVFGAQNIEVSAYDDQSPDLLVPSKRLQFEISCRWERPVDEQYLRSKRGQYPDFHLIVFCPMLSSGAKDAIKGGDIPDTEWKRFPAEPGFPVITPNGNGGVQQAYDSVWGIVGETMDIRGLYLRHYRTPNMIAYDRAVTRLKATLKRYDSYQPPMPLAPPPAPAPDYTKYMKEPVDWIQRFELLYYELGPARLAKTFGVTPGTVYRWMRTGRIPSWQMPSLKRKWYYEMR